MANVSCQEKKVHVSCDLNEVSPSFYYKWITQMQTRHASTGKDIEVKVTTKVRVAATAREMVEAINRLLPDFLKLVYRIHHQYISIWQLKENMKCMKCDECIIHIDFSENYVCKFHTETQSVHFGASRLQASVHTGVIYSASVNDAQERIVESTSFCSISDSTRHDPCAIWAHITPVHKFLVAKFSQVTSINFLSDGPTTQYRNRFNLYFLSRLPHFGPFTSATWNFSESGHGKGAADGIGGSLKRLADRLVAEGHNIPDPQSLYEILKGKTVTELFYITSDDISATEELLAGESVKRIPSTMRLHQVVFSKLDHIET